MAHVELEDVYRSVTSLRGELEHGLRRDCVTEVTIRPLARITERDVACWTRLARNAAEPNPFQEPQFVLPLAANRLIDEELHILVVGETATGDWLAACVFQSCPPTLTRPLPHLRSLSSRYSFLDSPLIHRDHIARAARSALAHLEHQRTWHGARFRIQRANGRQGAEWNRQSEALGVSVDQDGAWSRAVTNLRELHQHPLLGRCSRSRRKSLLRAQRWLENIGPVTHRLVSPDSEDELTCEDFLRLEALGWKGSSGTAIACQPADLRFFRQMVAGYAAEGRVLFGELRVGHQLIASTCNLVSGTVLFAFKVGWEPQFAKGNPGHWAEIELANALVKQRPDLTTIDSCSQQGSYVESVSTHTQAMGSATYVWSRRASALCEIRRQIRAIRTGWKATTAQGISSD